MKAKKLVIGVASVLFVAYASSYLVLAQCSWKCKDEMECVRYPNGICYKAVPETCFVGYVRNGGEASYICGPVGGGPQATIFECNDCNPECPQNSWGEAAGCSGCETQVQIVHYTECGPHDVSGEG